MNENAAYIKGILSQTLYGAGTFSVVLIYSHFSEEIVFGQISSIFILLNVLLGAVLVWATSKWRGDQANTNEVSISEKMYGINGAQVIVAISVGLIISGYSSIVFNLQEHLPLIAASAAVSVMHAIKRRIFILNGRLNSALILDGTRLIVFILFYVYWYIYEVSFEKFFYCILSTGSVALLVNIYVNRFNKTLDATAPNKSSFIQSLISDIAVSKDSRPLLWAGFFSTFSSQILTISTPLFVNPESLGVIRAYEILYFPLFFLIQAFDPVVSRRLVAANEKHHTEKIALAAKAAAFVFFLFALFLLCVYVIDFYIGTYPILIPKKFHDSFYLLWYLLVIGMVVAANVGLRWYGFGINSALNLSNGTLIGLATSILILGSLSHFELFLDGAYISRMTHEVIVFFFLSIASWKSRRN